METRSFIITSRDGLLRLPEGCCRSLVTGSMSLPDFARRNIRVMTPFIRLLEKKFHSISHLQISQTQLDKQGFSRMWSFFLMTFGGGHPIRLGEDGKPEIDLSLVESNSGHSFLFDEEGFISVLDALIRPEQYRSLSDAKPLKNRSKQSRNQARMLQETRI